MSTPPASSETIKPTKFLTVALADEAYGLSVLSVREIIRLQKITTIPQLPGFVRGVLNLRGRIIPILDLREMLGLVATVTERTCIVVIHIATGQTSRPMGLIVDSVDEVVGLKTDAIEPAPDFGTAVDTRFLLGIAKVNGRVLSLLDLPRLLGPETCDPVLSAA